MLTDEYDVTDLAGRDDVPLPEESGRTFAENAALKAISASNYVPGWIVADDSGLEVDALHGAPGVYSARYAGAKASDEANVSKLLRDLGHTAQRAARFTCVLVLARAGRLVAEFTGSIERRIAGEPRGSGGFGYDPVFIPIGYEQTFAEIPAETKNALSHRARAVAQLRAFLRSAA